MYRVTESQNLTNHYNRSRKLKYKISDFRFHAPEMENLSLGDVSMFATAAAKYCKSHQGLTVAEMPLYSLTVTEILRLHLLTSGAQINSVGAKWRYQERGGYDGDDPGLEFCLKDPDIVKYLSCHNIVELPTQDRIKLINCLINQILTFADVRDIIEERLVNNRQSKYQLKVLLTGEKKRQQELASAKFKLKQDTQNTQKFIIDETEKLNKQNETKIMKHEQEVIKLVNGSADNQILLG